MRAKCVKCGRRWLKGYVILLCDECVALAASEEKTVEVILELTQKELDVVARTLKEEAANLRYSGGGDWDAEAETLDKVADAFRTAPEDERSRRADIAHVQWLNAQ